MKYTASQIASILGLEPVTALTTVLSMVSTDTRSIRVGQSTLFFGITTMNRSGADYLHEAYDKGVRVAVIDRQPKQVPTDMVVLQVADSLAALQQLAAYHRMQFPELTVIGITGSYGKTIVKEWLAELLATRYEVIKSPQSFNSQIGVPLSVLRIEPHHEVAIFEVGVSEAEEMARLEPIVRPTHGIFTTIGQAHAGGFKSLQHKIKQKAILFATVHNLVYRCDHDELHSTLSQVVDQGARRCWSSREASTWYISQIDQSVTIYQNNEQVLSCTVHIDTQALTENAIHAAVMALQLEIPPDTVARILTNLDTLPMRLETSAGKEGCLLINDTYTADIDSLALALDYQRLHSFGYHSMLILSDIDDNHGTDWLSKAQELIDLHDVESLLTVGPKSSLLSAPSHMHFDNTEALLSAISTLPVADKSILIKGARKYRMERVYQRLLATSHSAALEIDLTAIEHNLKVYQSLADGKAIMVVIKAAAYGTGSVEVAKILQKRGVSYLAVAFADEAIALRQAHITLPILVLNPDLQQLDIYLDYDLTIELHSPDQLATIGTHLRLHPKVALGVHIMVDTGMRRLGFMEADLPMLVEWLAEQSAIEVVGICTHLAASESAAHDAFTQQQADQFQTMCDQLPAARYYHALNTAGIVRHGQQLSWTNMARLGIGLYGIDSTGLHTDHLQIAHRLTARVMQVKHLQKGESVGYNRGYIALIEEKICTINIGYADGILRAASDQGYQVYCKGKLLTVVGKICMDLMMCRIPEEVSIYPGDAVVLFGPEHSIDHLANAANTIPYEVLSRLSARVKRLYVQQ